jgi:hypothetical protein
MYIRRIALVVFSTLFTFALGTYLAGEQTEVVVLQTQDDAGKLHDTKMWIVDLDNVPYVRVGRPGRSWSERLEEHPEVQLIRGGVPRTYRAEVVEDEALRRTINDAFAEKYGWVDWWYGILIRRHPEPVRLNPYAT